MQGFYPFLKSKMSDHVPNLSFSPERNLFNNAFVTNSGFPEIEGASFERESLGILHESFLADGRESLLYRLPTDELFTRDSLELPEIHSVNSYNFNHCHNSKPNPNIVNLEHLRTNSVPNNAYSSSSEDNDKTLSDLSKKRRHRKSTFKRRASSILQRSRPSSHKNTKSTNAARGEIDAKLLILAHSLDRNLRRKSNKLNIAFVEPNSSRRSSVSVEHNALIRDLHSHWFEKNSPKFKQPIPVISAQSRTSVSPKAELRVVETSPTKSDELNDSVFLKDPQPDEEAEDLFPFLNKSTFHDSDFLSNTAPPKELLQLIEEEEESEVLKRDLNSVFNEVDKVIPPSPQKSPQMDNDSQSSSSSLEDVRTSRDSKAANEILHNLSAIFNTEHPSSRQIHEGQNLISSLSNLMINQSRVSLTNSEPKEDSGQSSIENEEVETATSQKSERSEALDLRVRKSTENLNSDDNSARALDLSMKSKKDFLSPKVLPMKVERSSSLNFTKERNYSTSSNESVGCSQSLSRLSFAGKFKPKKNSIEENRGPMKAVLPVDNMLRRKSLISPLSSGIRGEVSSTSKLIKPNTPVKAASIIPVAQSTPEGAKSSRFGRRLSAIAISPLARNYKPVTGTTLKEKLNYSSEKIEPIVEVPKLERRRSVSDMKNPQLSQVKSLNRSHSAGRKDSAISESVNRVRAAIKSGSIPRKSVLTENQKRQPFRGISPIRKSGKENRNNMTH